MSGDDRWVARPAGGQTEPASYTERYRGLASAGGDPPTPPRAPAPGRGRRFRLLSLLGGAALLVAIVAGSILGLGLLNGPPPRLRLATPPPPTVRPSPTPTPGLADDASVVDRFVALLVPANRSYRVTATEAVTGAGRDATIQLSGGVSGTRWTAQVTQTPASGTPRTGQAIRIDTSTWYRMGTGAWRRGTLPFPDLPDVDPCDGIAGRGDLVYLGAELHAGQWTHHLATRQGWVSPATTASLGAGMQLDSARMDVWVTPDGVPVEADYAVEIGIVNASGRSSYTIAVQYLLSQVGEKIRITAP